MRDNHKPNHKCLACGIEYYACDSCDQKISKTWRVACCTEEHYRAYYAMWQYGQGLLPKEEASVVLQEVDALSWDKAPGKALIREILDADEHETVQEAPAQEPEAVPEEAEETAGQPEPTYNRKNKKRHHDD